MNLVYKFSPLIVFIIGYFIWSNSAHNSPIILAGNGLIILTVVMIMALIPSIGTYLKGNRKTAENRAEKSLDDFEIATRKISFYSIFSKLVFYIGVPLCILIAVLKFGYLD